MGFGTRAEREISLEEVQQHGRLSLKKWIIIDNRVYDVTQWQNRHPGGRRLLAHHTGQDATVSITLTYFITIIQLSSYQLPFCDHTEYRHSLQKQHLKSEQMNILTFCLSSNGFLLDPIFHHCTRLYSALSHRCLSFGAHVTSGPSECPSSDALDFCVFFGHRSPSQSYIHS